MFALQRSDKMGHVSTGGGACLDYMAGKVLPGIASLEISADKFFMDIQEATNNVN